LFNGINWDLITKLKCETLKIRHFAEGRSFMQVSCKEAAVKEISDATVYMNARTRVSSFTLPRSRTYDLPYSRDASRE